MLHLMVAVSMLLGSARDLHAQGRAALPAGVSGVSFGTAQRYKDASGKEMCAIVQPLPEPVAFPRGVTEISYGVHLQLRAVKSASAQIVAPGSQAPLHRTPCDVFTLVQGGFSQTQLGSTIARGDKAPLRSGKYTLRITVDGQTADLPFTIE
jgi:hypothetical protein